MTMSKKEKRIESKKRKVAAFLELVDETNAVKAPNEGIEKKARLDDRDGGSVNVMDQDQARMDQERERIDQERLRILAELKERRKLAMERPKLFLTLDGLEDEDEERPPLFILDIQHLLLFALQGNSTSFKPRWCKLLRCTKVTSVVVVVLDSVGQTEYNAFKSSFSELNKMFEMSVPLVSPSQYDSMVDEELFHVPFSVSQIKDMGNQNEAAREISETTKPQFKYYLSQTRAVYSNLPDGDIFPRIHLLLSSSQMSSYKYPLPLKEKAEEHKDFVYTADRYSEVTSQSPMFAIDCEMCITSAKVSELTWVSVVNEDLEVIYESLVKPYNRIDNYLTRFSGITKELLAPVWTRLEEVQAHIRKILPPDAILCGQSLNSDLTALKMFHPYVIDTSIIYNLSGQNNAKSSLRKLANIFLGKLIQDETSGHNPCEDAIATMELVKLKLKRGIGYGDVRMGAIMYPGLEAKKYPKKSVKKGNTSEDSGNSTEKVDTVTAETEGEESIASTAVESDRTAAKTSSAESLVLGINEQVERRKHFFGFKDQDLQNSFFSKLQMAGKKATLVDEESVIEKYRGVSDCMTCIPTTSDKERKSEGKQAASSADFLWTQLHSYHKLLQNSDDASWEEKMACLKKMDHRLSSIIHAAPQGSICVVLLGGRTTENLTNNAMAFVKVKV